MLERAVRRAIQHVDHVKPVPVARRPSSPDEDAVELLDAVLFVVDRQDDVDRLHGHTPLATVAIVSLQSVGQAPIRGRHPSSAVARDMSATTSSISFGARLAIAWSGFEAAGHARRRAPQTHRTLMRLAAAGIVDAASARCAARPR